MGSPRQMFKKKVLAASVAALASVSYTAVAQDAPVEEVLVTGIRASLENAMDIKRDSKGVVDAISAEDIGKMPDQNLAESLQRITGLSISRTNGEGARVTARGIDPSLNMVTLNGRNMPAVTNDGNVADTASRAFDFANIASEVVNGVEVYKTGKANVTSGGLGATVNVKTVRPLDAGTKGVASLKLVNDTTAERGDAAAVTPEISGLYSWVDDEGVFGVAVAAAYQVRENSRSNAFVSQWKPETDIGVIADGATIRNAPTGLFNLPSDLRYALEDNKRTRLNGMATLQYAPSDAVTATLDVVATKYELEADRAQQSTWYNYSAISNIEFDYSTIPAPTIYQEAYGGDKDVSFAQQEYTGVTDMTSVGLNVEWDVNDQLSLVFDFHSSSAENVSDRAEAGLNANIVTGNFADFSEELPVMGVRFNDSDLSNGNNNGVIDGGDISGAIGTIDHAEQTTDITQFQLHGTFAISDESNLNFGGEFREDVNLTVVGQGGSTGRITMGNWGGIDPSNFGEAWPSLFSARDFGEGFPDYERTTGYVSNDMNDWFLSNGVDADLGDVKAVVEAMNAIAQTSPVGEINPSNFNSFVDTNGDGVGDTFTWNGINNVNREITEEVTSLYLSYDREFVMGDKDASIVAGLRYENTDVTSVSTLRLPNGIRWDEDNDWSQIIDAEFTAFTDSASYSNLLPNVDFSMNASEDVVVRASWSKTMGRAGYADLRAETALDNLYSRTANVGNPELEPMESRNLDISTEWYYGEGNYLSVGYFQKDVSNFIGSSLIYSDWYGILDPREGERFNAAIAQLETAQDNGDLHPFRTDADGNAVVWNPEDEAHQHDRILLNMGLDPEDQSTSVVGDADTDPLAIWATTKPVNDRDAEIYGFEFALQHWFGDSGFGTQLNYTAVNADVKFDVTKTTGQFALVGLSDTANISFFYDDNDIQARISYNWRDKFLDNRNQFNNEPSFTEAYYQLDLSASYNITEDLNVSFEGLNLTGENSRRHGRSVNQLWSLEDLGARYALGVRYSF